MTVVPHLRLHICPNGALFIVLSSSEAVVLSRPHYHHICPTPPTPNVPHGSETVCSDTKGALSAFVFTPSLDTIQVCLLESSTQTALCSWNHINRLFLVAHLHDELCPLCRSLEGRGSRDSRVRFSGWKLLLDTWVSIPSPVITCLTSEVHHGPHDVNFV